MIFTRGDLPNPVSSVGLTLNVTPLAKALDNQLSQGSDQNQRKKAGGLLPAKALKGTEQEKEKTVLMDPLPANPDSGCDKGSGADGEIRKEGDTLYLVNEPGGDRTVEIIICKLE